MIAEFALNFAELRRELQEYFRWALMTFHDETIAQQATHLVKECRELEERPTSHEELADVFMMASLIAYRALLQSLGLGYDMQKAVVNKLATNRARKWRRTPDGDYQHVVETEAKRAPEPAPPPSPPSAPTRTPSPFSTPEPWFVRLCPMCRNYPCLCVAATFNPTATVVAPTKREPAAIRCACEYRHVDNYPCECSCHFSAQRTNE